MPLHFREFTSARTSPDLILIPQRLSIGTAIEELLLVWECNGARDFVNQVLATMRKMRRETGDAAKFREAWTNEARPQGLRGPYVILESQANDEDV